MKNKSSNPPKKPVQPKSQILTNISDNTPASPSPPPLDAPGDERPKTNTTAIIGPVGDKAPVPIPVPPKTSIPIEIPKNPPRIRDEQGKYVKGKPPGPGNAKGFPQIPATLRKILNEEIETGKHGKRKRFELLLRRVVEKAMKGEAWAVQFVADRTEGKVKERISIETDGLTFEEIKAMSKTEREELKLTLRRSFGM